MLKHISSIAVTLAITATASAQPYYSGRYNVYQGNNGYSDNGNYSGYGNYRGGYAPGWGYAPNGYGRQMYGTGYPYGYGGQGYRMANPYGYGYGGQQALWGNPNGFVSPTTYDYANRPQFGYNYAPEYGSASPLPYLPGANTSVGNYLNTLGANTATANGASPAAATVIDNMSTSNKPAPATVTVIVPDGGQVWFNNSLNPPKSGSKWVYTTETLQPNKMVRIPVKATWKENGKEEDYTLRVPVEAGDSLTIDLHARK